MPGSYRNFPSLVDWAVIENTEQRGTSKHSNIELNKSISERTPFNIKLTALPSCTSGTLQKILLMAVEATCILFPHNGAQRPSLFSSEWTQRQAQGTVKHPEGNEVSLGADFFFGTHLLRSMGLSHQWMKPMLVFSAFPESLTESVGKLGLEPSLVLQRLSSSTIFIQGLMILSAFCSAL